VIRKATLDDLQEVIELGAEFHAACPYSQVPLDREAWGVFAGKLIENGVVFLSDHGMIGGVLNAIFFNPNYLTAAELFWWAPKEGQALLAAFEAWAIENGAKALQFAGLRNERSAAIERIFARNGFRPTETAYFKELPA
jgi:hypothetical protein